MPRACSSQLLKVRAALTQSGGERGAERVGVLAREVVTGDETVDRPRGVLPPDRVPQQNRPILGKVIGRRLGEFGGALGLVLVLLDDPALSVVPVEILGGVLGFGDHLEESCSQPGSDPLSNGLRLPLGGVVGDQNAATAR